MRYLRLLTRMVAAADEATRYFRDAAEARAAKDDERLEELYPRAKEIKRRVFQLGAECAEALAAARAAWESGEERPSRRGWLRIEARMDQYEARYSQFCPAHP